MSGHGLGLWWFTGLVGDCGGSWTGTGDRRGGGGRKLTLRKWLQHRIRLFAAAQRLGEPAERLSQHVTQERLEVAGLGGGREQAGRGHQQGCEAGLCGAVSPAPPGSLLLPGLRHLALGLLQRWASPSSV